MEMLVTALICLPFLWAILPAVIHNSKCRAFFVYLGCGIVIVLSVFTAVQWYLAGGQTLNFDLPYREAFDGVILFGDLFLMCLITYLSFKYKKGVISLLAIVQTLLVAGLEFFGPELEELPALRFDWLTLVMILIIGVVGSLIGIYAVGYMHGYHIHHHKELTDRRSFFLAMIFVFFGAMFGLVFSQSLIWMYFFWEITSVTSFLLIGYTRSEEAINNSFKALWMNLLGGCGIAAAIAVGILAFNTVNLYDIINLAIEHGTSAHTLIFLLPIACLAFAALTKSAQFPFSGWLLGAMVAPTPSSALLHSATMVKAGVYLLIRISAAMADNYVGNMVALIGGFTFLAASCLAISVSDGKKVLAYSTISNLGLIVACTGCGYEETIWAAVFLVIFHAVSKSMLFQCVGAIENTTGSRDVEDMQGLMAIFPKLAIILMIGIAGMFLAPFGMLISKWAALKAFIDTSSVYVSSLMVLFICFGSATTMFYWTKWMSKILGASPREKSRDLTKKNEYISMFFHAIMMVALILGFPWLSEHILKPLSEDMFGVVKQVISYQNIIIMIVLLVGVFVIPCINYVMTKGSKAKQVITYMGGANVGDNFNFVSATGDPKEMHIANFYMEDIMGEKKLFTPAIMISTFIIIVYMIIVVGGAF
ncbi:NADH-quinone oxidoreductase subunit 5 family protein [Pseudobutyrivibrio sp.]|uniref:NADH-quinone oxidoreductase subunit 5 family protein n=1 Tax=Pseudobutyrivibrio sp. TaxID=2014367 RepID=UPI001B7A83CB|nr:proton-conducting transporter membrane subunit [Pseudobutyrivibrio sp.]MBP5595625.1 NADH-quinone oxidoreductase subunit L [Pseudobutyrivibrio sp.]MBQ7468804.1 NADH-quinone oxidoreductase subunit L [Pseudobutyrivibrio sp.]MBR5648991.1 NADH-quinone oxidoreductase subunit L [Pseudobutyrivibrio sp.]